MRRIGLLAAIIAIGSSGSASAATIQVDSGTDDGTACTLRDAIASADGNADSGGCAGSGGYGDDTITFAPGITGTINTGGQLNIDPTQPGTLHIQGPGADALALDVNQNARVINVTANADSAANAVTISGLELRDGLVNAPDDMNIARGAGVLSLGRLTLDRVVIDSNRVSVGDVSSPFAFTLAVGGGVSSFGQELVVADSSISGNSVESSATGTSINIASGTGGGIGIGSGSATIRRTTISGNQVTATANNGSQNNANAEGGGTGQMDGTAVTLEGSTVVANGVTAIGMGGGVRNAFGGGAMVVGQSIPASLSVEGSTVAANSAVTGSNFNTGAAGSIVLESSAVAEPAGGGTNCNGAVSSNERNLADDTSCNLTDPGDQPGIPAGLQALADNGGPTLTRRPAPGSALIDGGSAAGQSQDQRGLTRTVDYDTANGAGGDGTDIGAVEIQGAVPTSTSPASPNTDSTPEVKGTAEPGSSVLLFGDTTCTDQVGSGNEPAFTGPGIATDPLALGDTEIRAVAQYGAALSPCSAAGVSYTRTAPPATDPGTGTTPPPTTTPPPKCKKGQKLKGGRCVKKKRKKKKKKKKG